MTNISELRDIIRKKVPKIHSLVNEELRIDFRHLIEDNTSFQMYMKKKGKQASSNIGGRIGYAFENVFDNIFKRDKRFNPEDVAGHDFLFQSTPIEMKTTKMQDGFTGSDYSSKCENFILIGYDLTKDILTKEIDMIEGFFVYVGPIDSKYWKAGTSKKNTRSTLLIPNEEYDNMKDGIVYGDVKIRKRSTYLFYERVKINDKKRRIAVDNRTKGIGIMNRLHKTYSMRSININKTYLRIR